MKFIRAGYTKSLNMFNTFVLVCQPYAQEKYTICMDRNGLEWPGMITRTNLTWQYIRHSENWALGFSLLLLEHNRETTI